MDQAALSLLARVVAARAALGTALAFLAGCATQTAPPTTADAIQANPFGLYVTEIRWTKQL